ncbi:MAG: hypothetical protein ACI4MJ_00835 [Aristaeellaceae bacterium]
MRKTMLMKLLTCMLVATLLMTVAASAFATTAQLTSTQTFLDYLDANDIKYTYVGMTDKGHERVTVSYTGDNFDTLQVTLTFDKAEDEVDLRMWNIITVSAGQSYTYATLQQLNADYKYCKFVLDTSDSTLQTELDMFIDKDHCGRSVYDAMRYMVIVVDDDDVAAIIKTME